MNAGSLYDTQGHGRGDTVHMTLVFRRTERSREILHAFLHGYEKWFIEIGRKVWLGVSENTANRRTI